SYDLVAGKPRVGLLEFINDEQFGSVDRPVLGDQVLISRDALDPGSAGVELVVQHQLVRGEAQALGATKCCHNGDELFVNDFDSDFTSLRDGRIGKHGRGDRGSVVGRRVYSTAGLAEHFVG